MGFSPLNVYSQNESTVVTEMEKKLDFFVFQHMKKSGSMKKLQYKLLSESKNWVNLIVKTEKDADEVCRYSGVDYLLYGSVERGDYFYDVQLYIYSYQEKKTISTIYDRHNITDLLVMAEDLSVKVKREISDTILKITKDKGQVKFSLANHIGFHIATGYTLPISSWGELLYGVINGEFGIKIMRIKPFYHTDTTLIYLRPGFLFSYSFNLSRPGLVESYYHMFLFKIPIELCLTFYDEKIGIIIGSGVQVQFDFLYQKFKYKNDYYTQSVAASTFASLAFESFPGKSKVVGVGLNNLFDFTFYNNLYVDYKIQVYNIIRFKEKKVY
jgi:hypothetical protein